LLRASVWRHARQAPWLIESTLKAGFDSIDTLEDVKRGSIAEVGVGVDEVEILVVKARPSISDISRD
jgi:hypothetical protein